MFHSISNRADGKCSEKQYLFQGLVRFQLFFVLFCLSSKRLYDIPVTWFDRFLRRDGDSVPH